jgi:hypothetical protein
LTNFFSAALARFPHIGLDAQQGISFGADFAGKDRTIFGLPLAPKGGPHK